MDNIRNFVIIAHIDHGKSTLADRLLELTESIEKRKMQEQFLDQMDLEREKGITIKMQPVRMSYTLNSKFYILNLIDTPGHVDFSYEVSRSLVACEGAILLVDGTQGIQAQTLTNLHFAQKEGLKIIPAINKVDLPNCRLEETKNELSKLLNVDVDEIIGISAKTGLGVEKILEAVVKKIPSPKKRFENQLNALIFDSHFDPYKGVVAYVRVFDGEISKNKKLFLATLKGYFDVLEVGSFRPNLIEEERLEAGQIGYAATGIKEPEKIRVGDTIVAGEACRDLAMPGYEEPKPMVFASIYPQNADDFDILKDAIAKLKLNDASLVYEPESSETLGRGYRCGFLGMLHMEIIGERLKREYGLEVVITTPSVSYRITNSKNNSYIIHSASELSDVNQKVQIEEPWIKLEIVSPSLYLGRITKLVQNLRAVYINTEYLSPERLLLIYEVPLSEVVVNFYDDLKSVTEGYASMNYLFLGYRVGDLVKLDVLIANEKVEAFSQIIPSEKVYYEGREITSKLKDIIPKQLFAVSIQAAIGGKIIARETISALKKDVTGYLYGGDRTRKMKLWQKQKEGKKKLQKLGKVNLPADVFLKVLRRKND